MKILEMAKFEMVLRGASGNIAPVYGVAISHRGADGT